MTQPVHILVLASATSPWILHGCQWSRRFEDEEGNTFLLVGPRLNGRLGTDL